MNVNNRLKINGGLTIVPEIIDVSANSASSVVLGNALTQNMSNIALNNSSSPIDISGGSLLEPGHFLIISQIDAGTQSHRVKLSSGCTYDGTNTIATFNAQYETLVLFAVSTTRYVIIENIGGVVLS